MLETKTFLPNGEPAKATHSSMAHRLIDALKGSGYTRLVWRGSLAVAFGCWLVSDQLTTIVPVNISAETIQSGFITDSVELDASQDDAFAVLLREVNIRQFGYTRVGTGRIDDGVTVFVMHKQFQHWAEFALVLSSPGYRADDPHSTIRHSLDIYGNPDPNAFAVFPELTEEETPEMLVVRIRGSLASKVRFTNMSFADDGTTFTLFFDSDGVQQTVTISRSSYGLVTSSGGWQLVAGPPGTRVLATSYTDFEKKLLRTR